MSLKNNPALIFMLKKITELIHNRSIAKSLAFLLQQNSQLTPEKSSVLSLLLYWGIPRQA